MLIVHAAVCVAVADVSCQYSCHVNIVHAVVCLAIANVAQHTCYKYIHDQ